MILECNNCDIYVLMVWGTIYSIGFRKCQPRCKHRISSANSIHTGDSRQMEGSVKNPPNLHNCQETALTREAVTLQVPYIAHQMALAV